METVPQQPTAKPPIRKTMPIVLVLLGAVLLIGIDGSASGAGIPRSCACNAAMACCNWACSASFFAINCCCFSKPVTCCGSAVAGRVWSALFAASFLRLLPVMALYAVEMPMRSTAPRRTSTMGIVFLIGGFAVGCWGTVSISWPPHGETRPLPYRSLRIRSGGASELCRAHSRSQS